MSYSRVSGRAVTEVLGTVKDPDDPRPSEETPETFRDRSSRILRGTNLYAVFAREVSCLFTGDERVIET